MLRSNGGGCFILGRIVTVESTSYQPVKFFVGVSAAFIVGKEQVPILVKGQSVDGPDSSGCRFHLFAIKGYLQNSPL